MRQPSRRSIAWEDSSTWLFGEDRFEAAVENAAERLLHSVASGCVSSAFRIGDRLCGNPLPSSSRHGNYGINKVEKAASPSLTPFLNACFASVKSIDDASKAGLHRPPCEQLLKHPLALVSYLPKDVALFFSGALAGAVAKTITAPLDRIKLLMQVYGVKTAQEHVKKSIGLLEATSMIWREEGIMGYWKGNLPQVIRIVPYSAVQLFAYEMYKKLFQGNDQDLSVAGRLAAGACAGMTSTLVTYPLDVLRLRLAVDPACKTMGQVATIMLQEEGLSSFYRGLGPSLLGIAPYIAMNFCVFDLVKKSFPEHLRKRPEVSFVTALASATIATAVCYPLDTVRRQMQMKGTPYESVLEAIPGIIARDGIIGLYRGFIPNALKNLPNSSIRLTIFDSAKSLITASQKELQRLLNMQKEQLVHSQL